MRARRAAPALVALLVVCGCGGAPGGAPSGTPLATRPQSTPGTAAPAASAGAGEPGDWPVYHGSASRAGTGDGPDPRSAHQVWQSSVDGSVQASPVVARGIAVVATENDSVYAFEARTGRRLWMRHLGEPVPRSDLPCGNIAPLGITGTPVVDTASGVVAVVTETAGGRHTLVELDLSTGAVRGSAGVDPAGSDPIVHQQRGALALVAGRIVVPFGGLNGDCGDYRGRLVGVDEASPATQHVFTVPTSREGGIWAPPGPVVDGAGRILVAVGNGESTGGFDGSESVVALDPDMRQLDYWAAGDWAALNAGDVDIGSVSPALLPGGLALQGGKSGRVDVLRLDHLGGIGGQVTETAVCDGVYGGTAVSGSTVLLPCTDGEHAVRVDADGSVHPLWTAEANGSPVVSGDVAWVPAAGTVQALSMADGSVLGSVATPQNARFTTPALSGGLMLVASAGVVRAFGG